MQSVWVQLRLSNDGSNGHNDASTQHKHDNHTRRDTRTPQNPNTCANSCLKARTSSCFKRESNIAELGSPFFVSFPRHSSRGQYCGVHHESRRCDTHVWWTQICIWSYHIAHMVVERSSIETLEGRILQSIWDSHVNIFTKCGLATQKRNSDIEDNLGCESWLVKHRKIAN